MGIEPGALARTTHDNHENGYSYRKGTEFEVEDYVSAEDAECDSGKGYYYGSNHGGFNNVEVREDHVELVRSQSAMRARKLPTPAELAEHLASEALGFGDLNIDEADYSSGNGYFEVYGTTAEGLRFAAAVKVLDIDGTDF